MTNVKVVQPTNQQTGKAKTIFPTIATGGHKKPDLKGWFSPQLKYFIPKFDDDYDLHPFQHYLSYIEMMEGW